MTRRATITAARWLTAAAAGAGALYAGYAALAWLRYGAVTPPGPDERDELLDQFMPEYEVAERHSIGVAAPAAVTFAAACDFALQSSPIVRAIIRAREVILRAHPDAREMPHGILAETQALGWGVLATVPGREVVVGAVTRPWEANVVFRAVPADEFAAFREPGYVKIVWTLRADPVDACRSTFRTETRVVATDATARRRFRRYWAFVSPGIIAIRWAVLRPLKRDAERRAARAAAD
jgi:hypothetical protein